MSIINEQIQLILEELDLIQDPYQRADIRTKLISCIAESNLEVSVEEPVGKDAIKNDIKKEQDAPIEFKEVKEEVVEETEPETKEEVKEEVKEESKKKKATKGKSIASKSKKGPKEIELEKPEKKVVTVEDENGDPMEVDITEVYHKIAPAMKEDGADEETIELTAQYLVCNALIPIYETLEGLKDSYNKMMLAYYMQEFGVEAINESVISQISDGQIDDLYEFVNDSNLQFTIESIEAATESEDEE